MTSDSDYQKVEDMMSDMNTDDVERARDLFLTWMRTRPGGIYQSSIQATEATRLFGMIAAALRDEREDWRGRLATQCGQTLAARQERDEALRQAKVYLDHNRSLLERLELHERQS